MQAPLVNDWLRDYLVFCLFSGMRQGEIRNLKWENIYFPEGGYVQLTIQTGKTRKLRRIHCGLAVTRILRTLMPESNNCTSKVFPYPQIAVKRAWLKLRQLTGYSDITLHNFRTSNATYAANSGVELATLAARLGHTDLTMLGKHYIGSSQSAEDIASKKIEDAFSQLISAAESTGS
jgi:integrase